MPVLACPRVENHLWYATTMTNVHAMVNSTMSAVPPGEYQNDPDPVEPTPLVLAEGTGVKEGVPGPGIGVQIGGSKSLTLTGHRKSPTGGEARGPKEGPPVTLNQPCTVHRAQYHAVATFGQGKQRSVGKHACSAMLRVPPGRAYCSAQTM